MPQALIHDLVAKKDYITVKSEVDKLDINTLVNIPTSLNDSRTKVDGLDFVKLKTSCRLEKIKWCCG